MGRCMSLTIGCFVVVMALLEGGTAVEYTVGDSVGWNVTESKDFYNDVWAHNKTFLIGDTLLFNWTGTHTVADTSKEDYEKCNIAGGMIHSTSPVQINLTANGSRYFICTIGRHCELGQKLEVTVGGGTHGASAAPSPPPVAIPASLSVVLISMLTFIA